MLKKINKFLFVGLMNRSQLCSRDLKDTKVSFFSQESEITDGPTTGQTYLDDNQLNGLSEQELLTVMYNNFKIYEFIV